MSEIMEFLKIYKDYGAAGIFMTFYVITVYFFYKELKSSKAEAVAMTVLVTTVADKATAAITEMNDAALTVKSGMDQLRAQNNEFMSFLRGRDENRRSR